MRDGDISFFPRHIGRNTHFLQPSLTTLPSHAADKSSRRADHVGRTFQQVATPVTVVVHGMLEVVRWQELRLAQLAGPRPDHRLRTKVAAIYDAKRIHQLAPEHVAAPAVVSQRCERAENGQLTHAD